MIILTMKSCVFNNFMSYGNNANEFTFPKGVIWMCADNGSGKSTLVEAISFALFGTSYRGGNKSELRNTRNTDGTMRVMLEFDCEKVAGVVETYRVTRSISPKGTVKFEVEKLEGETWVTQSKRAGYSQKDFETNVLGFNEVLFKNTIAMNTQESVPFTEMPLKDRRAMLESIIMVTYDPWKKETASRLSAACTAFDIAESDITRINGEIANLNAICDRLCQEKKANMELLLQQLSEWQAKAAPANEKLAGLRAQADAKKAEIDGYAAAVAREGAIDQAIVRIQAAGTEIGVLSRYRADLEAAETELAAAIEEYGKYGKDALEAESARITGEINSILTSAGQLRMSRHTADADRVRLEGERDSVVEQGKNLKPGTPCPTCGKPSTEADIEPHKQELRRRFMKLRDDAQAKANEVASYDTKIAELDTKKAELDAQAAELKTRIGAATAYYTNSVVPVQGRVSSLRVAVKNSESTIAAAGIDPAQFAAELERLTAEKKRFQELRTKWQAAYDEWNTYAPLIAQAQSEVDVINGNVNRLNNEVTIAKERAADDSLAIAEKQLNSAMADLGDAELRLHTESDNRLAYEYIGQKMCSDDGIKKMIFSKFVPQFNQSVARNIRRLNLPFTLEFDESMDFTYHADPGFAPSYDMLSQGQRRKLGFAISMAFRDFVTMVGNFKINFLSMDEVLDVSTDDTGMREMLDIVRDMADEIGCALVITHRGSVVADRFDYRITVDYDGNYSTLGELEKL